MQIYEVLKRTIAQPQPDQILPKDFWFQAFTKPDKTYGYFDQIINRLVFQIYQVDCQSPQFLERLSESFLTNNRYFSR